MRSTLVAGYYGMSNTGDDALLAVASWGARRLFGSRTLRATASSIPCFPGSDLVKPAFPRAQFFPGETRVRMVLESLRASGVVFGGGSVFHSVRDIRRFRRWTRNARPGPSIATGVSLGPMRDAAAERECARLLEALDFTGLRDPESYDIARAIAPRARTALTFDLAVLLPLLGGTSVGNDRDERTVGISVCNFERFVGRGDQPDLARQRKLRALVAALDARLVREVVLIDFNGHATYGDVAIHDDIAEAVPAGIAVTHVGYDREPLRVLERIRSLGVLVAMRLHAAVFAYMAGTPCVMLSYHPKCLGWAQQIGKDPADVHDSLDFDPEAVAARIHLALRGEPLTAALSLQEAQDRALQNFPPDLGAVPTSRRGARSSHR